MVQKNANPTFESIMSDRLDFDLDEQDAMKRTSIRIHREKDRTKGEGNYGEIPPMRWGILDDDSGYFYCITYNSGRTREQIQSFATWCLEQYDTAAGKDIQDALEKLE